MSNYNDASEEVLRKIDRYISMEMGEPVLFRHPDNTGNQLIYCDQENLVCFVIYKDKSKLAVESCIYNNIQNMFGFTNEERDFFIILWMVIHRFGLYVGYEIQGASNPAWKTFLIDNSYV